MTELYRHVLEPELAGAAAGQVFWIRPASREDIPAVTAIESQVYSTPWSEQSFLAELTHERSLFWVFLVDQTIVGYQIGWKVLEAYHLHNIALHRSWRGLGFAHEALDFLRQYVARIAIRAIELEVRASNMAALELYRRFGFEAVGLRRRYYRQPTEDAVLMRFLV